MRYWFREFPSGYSCPGRARVDSRAGPSHVARVSTRGHQLGALGEEFGERSSAELRISTVNQLPHPVPAPRPSRLVVPSERRDPPAVRRADELDGLRAATLERFAVHDA